MSLVIFHSSHLKDCQYLNLLGDIAGDGAGRMEAIALETAGRNGGAAYVVDGIDVEVEEGEDEDHQVPASSLHPLTVAQSCLVSKV